MLYSLRLLKPTLTRNVDRWKHSQQNWKRKPLHLIMERWLGMLRNTNSVVNPSVMQSNRQNVSVETKWSHNSTAQTRDVYVAGSANNHGLQKQNQPCRGHRRLASGQAKHLLRPTLKITQCHRRGPLSRTVGFPSPWLTWVRHLSVLTLARLPAKMASLAASSDYAHIRWL
jgi:hypothetical protein